MGILERQNEMNSLKIQTTARLLYNKANTIDTIEWIVVISLCILKVFYSQSIHLNCFLIIWFFISFFLDFLINKYTEVASGFKKSFDYYVYGWTSNYEEKTLFVSRKYEAKNKNYYETQVFNSGVDDVRGVKDWYTSVEENMSQEEAIKSAMKENIYFDDRINSIPKICILIFFVILVVVLLNTNLTFYEVLLGLFVTFAVFTQKIYSTYINLKKVSIINSNIEDLLCNKDIKLFYLQTEIDKKRSIPRTSNKVIYFLKTKKIHDEITLFLPSNSKNNDD